jgi:hypothetical protein
MATCRLCNQSGWFLKVSRNGLCKNCEPVWRMDLEQHQRILTESLKIIENSTNIKTQLSRIDVAKRSAEALRRYEQCGVQTTATKPSEIIRQLDSVRIDVATQYVRDQLTKARAKSQNAVGVAGMTSPFSKIIDSIGELYSVLPDVPQIKQLETEARNEMDRARVRAELDRAAKAKFKGETKKAISAYLDALYIIRRDRVDDREQGEQIREIERQIKELGGVVPPAA